jgi:predicted homoserine dehydrogenase-like protein
MPPVSGWESAGCTAQVCRHVTEAIDLFPGEQMLNGGLVDYILGAEPGPGVFVIGYNDHPIKQQYAHYFKMGDGPFYMFYVPYHLPHLEVPITVARAVLFNDAAIAPLGPPVCEVITMAKRNLKKGEVIDGIGGFTCYGTLENHDIVSADGLLPMGLAEGCRLLRDITMDQALTFEDVKMPMKRLCDRLRAEQNMHFKG